MSNDHDDNFPIDPERLRRAGTRARPTDEAGLGAKMVARGRWRRQRQQWGVGIAAASVFVFGIQAMTTLDDRRGPIVTNPIESLPAVGPTEAPVDGPEADTELESDDTAAPAAAQPGPVGTPLPLPTGLPTPGPSPSPSASPKPSPRPSASSSQAPAGPKDDGTNDGATDTGVTGDEVLIYVLVEETGATPGTWDRSAQMAMEAFAVYAQEQLGQIHGRTIRVEFRDARYDPTSARQVAREACGDGFAIVGAHLGMDQTRAVSQFLQVDKCPGLFAEITGGTAGMDDNPWVSWVGSRWSPDKGDVRRGPWAAFASASPSAVERSAWLTYGVEGNLAFSGEADMEGQEPWIDVVQDVTSGSGYEWILDARVQHRDLWYSQEAERFVQEGVGFARLEVLHNDTLRFLQKLSERGHELRGLSLWDRVYSDALLDLAGDDMDEARIALDHLPWFEADRSPVLARYQRWLDEVFGPGAIAFPGGVPVEPTTTGLRAWAAAERFVEDLRAMGADPTREELAERWQDATEWDASGAITPRSLTERSESRCWVTVKADTARVQWVRESGSRGTYRCVS